MNDLKFAFRQLLKNPGFTAVAVLTIALGIGANLALFGILNELFLRPKPVAHPEELWAISPADSTGQPVYGNVCRPYYEAVRRDARAFKSVIGYASIMPKLRTKEGAERIAAELVSGDYFSSLKVSPVLGRGFLPEEDAAIGAHSVAVISHAFWQSQFNGAADVLGTTLKLNNQVVEIVGVAPKEFVGLDTVQPSLWMPTSMEQMLDEFTNYRFVGRLSGPKLAVVATDLLSPVAAEVTRELSGFKDPRWLRYGYSPNFQAFRLEPVGRGVLGVSFMKSRIVGFMQFGGVAAILLLGIASANVANLLLVRALQRRKEMATRVALGATRLALVRQLIQEGVLLSVGGAAGALLMFSWAGSLIMKFASWWKGPVLSPTPDWRVLLFAAGSALLVGIGFSVFPAFHATGFDPITALKDAESNKDGRRKHGWLRPGLIVMQIVGSLALLSGATLCLRSMSRQLATELGYRSDRLAIAPLNLERIGFTTNSVARQLQEIVRRMALVPGVEEVGVSAREPLAGWESSRSVPGIEGYRSTGANNPVIAFADIGPNAFAGMGVSMLRGREISHEDIELDRQVVVVNESFVQKFWPGQEPLGKHIGKSEVIGVVSDVRFNRFDKAPEVMMFQAPGKESLLQAKLLIRAKGDSRQLVSSLRAELTRIHPRLLQGEVNTLRGTMKNALAIQRASLRVLGVLGGLALALVFVGVYGVMTYAVTTRTREIGIRLAVGATRGSVTHLILMSGLRIGIIALGIGLPVSLAAAGILRHQLAGISPFDPVSFVTVAVCVLAALLSACWLPARRAARVDPMVALRYE